MVTLSITSTQHRQQETQQQSHSETAQTLWNNGREGPIQGTHTHGKVIGTLTCVSLNKQMYNPRVWSVNHRGWQCGRMG